MQVIKKKRNHNFFLKKIYPFSRIHLISNLAEAWRRVLPRLEVLQWETGRQLISSSSQKKSWVDTFIPYLFWL